MSEDVTSVSSTPETDELIDGLAEVGVKVYEALMDDGRVDFGEGLGMLKTIPAVRKALKGIGAVPAEILHASDAAHGQITRRLVEKLSAFKTPHRVQDIAAEIATWLLFTMRTVVRIQQLPRSAEAA
jgi:hypothetical protein